MKPWNRAPTFEAISTCNKQTTDNKRSISSSDDNQRDIDPQYVTSYTADMSVATSDATPATADTAYANLSPVPPMMDRRVGEAWEG